MTPALLLLCAVVMLPNADCIPHNMVKRSDDPNPLESVVMQHSSDLDHIKAQLSGLQTTLGKFLVCSCFLLLKKCFKNILMLSHPELHNRIQLTQTATTGNTVLCKQIST